MKKHILVVTVAQADYEADMYGRPDCYEKSIKVPMIRVCRAVQQGSLKFAKDTVEALGIDLVGRRKLTFLTDDAGIGRITCLIQSQKELDATRAVPAHSTFEIDSITTLGAEVIVA